VTKRFGNKPGRKPQPMKVVDEQGKHPTTGAPKMPGNLSVAAKGVWRTTVNELLAMGIPLAAGDRAVLGDFANHYVNAKAAQHHLDVEGLVLDVLGKHGDIIGRKVSEYVRIEQKESELMEKAGTLLGCNPSSRLSLHAVVHSSSLRDLERPRSIQPPNVRSFLEPPPVSKPDQEESDGDLPFLSSELVGAPISAEPAVPIVEPEPGPTEVNPDDVQAQGEPTTVAEPEKKPKGTVNWAFPKAD
jgi:phage terminase small subunit